MTISLPKDANRITVIGGVSSTDGITPTSIYIDPTTHRLKVDSPRVGFVSSGKGTNLAATAATSYYDSSNGGNTDITQAGNIVCSSHTVQNLYIIFGSNALTTGTMICTLMKNGVATSITTTAAAGATTTVSDTTHTFSVVAGDY